MEQGKKKLSGKEKFAYGIGAVGKDMVYMLSASYILYYYQDIMGVSAWVMGIILLIARVFDAFNDPLMGVLVAKTKTKWGKFRPWLFIGTLTNAVVLFVMFAAPPKLSGSGLVAYAAIFYILWGVTYTMMDIPYWSMVPAFTDGGKERENMSALGRTCAGVGSAIVTVVTVMAVSFLGNAATTNSANNVTNSYTNVTAYVAEMDETGAATGNVKTLSGDVSLNVTADKSEFEEALSFNASNAKYDVTAGSLTYSSEGGDALTLQGLDVAKDSAEGEAVICLYVTEDEFSKITDGDSVGISLTSKKEVEREGFKWFSLIIAVLFFAFILITCLFIKEKSTVDVQTAKVGDMFKALLQNDQAMAMVITIVLVNSATYITSNLLIYFFKYDLGGANWQGNYTTFNTFAGACQILAMMALFPLLRKWFSTMKIFYICIFSAIGGYIVLLIMALTGTSIVYPFFAPGFFIMAAVGMLNVIVTVFLANTVDYGELKNNRRDESVIFSMQTFVVKLASGIAALAASICLSVFNISESDSTYEAIDGSFAAGLKAKIADIMANGATVVSGSSVIGLRFVMTVLPVFVLVIALIIFRARYKLTDEKLEEITKQLAAKKA